VYWNTVRTEMLMKHSTAKPVSPQKCVQVPGTGKESLSLWTVHPKLDQRILMDSGKWELIGAKSR